MNTDIKIQLNFLLKPLAILSTLIVFVVVSILLGLKQVETLKTSISSANKNVVNLQNKVEILESVEDVLSDDTTFLDIVLPSKGAVLYGLNQVKNQALINNVAISSLKTGLSIPESSDVYKNTISFEVEGGELSVQNFLESFATILPLMNVDKVSINKAEDISRASVTLTVYSSELPKKLPAVSDSTKELTKDEIEMLKNVATYTLPTFIEPRTAEISSGRENPFTQ